MTEPGAPARRDDVRRGILLTVVVVFIFATQDATTKILVADHSPFQVTMIRYWAFAAFSLFLVLRQGPIGQAFRSTVLVLQIVRGVLLVVDICFFALSLESVPLAELQSIVLVYPLIVTLAAIPLLGEKVGLFRFSAVAVGFAGAMVIVRPGGLPFSWGVLFGLGSATAYAVYIVLTRKVSQTDPTATSMFYVGVIGLVATTAIGVFFWTPFDLKSLLFMCYVMTTSCAAHGLMMVALASAPASVLQPFNYTSLPWSILLSYLVFGHLIDPISLAGAAVIVAAGLVVMARERMKRVPHPDASALPGKE